MIFHPKDLKWFWTLLDGATTDDVVLLWKEDNAVQVTRYSDLQKFRLKNISSDYCSTYSTTSMLLCPVKSNTKWNASINFIAAEYSCLKTNFLLERNLLHYLIQIYIPCCILVFASWISFWLNQEAVTARVLLSECFLLLFSDCINKFKHLNN